MADFTLDTSKFDATLTTYLGRLKREDWPRAINKKLFFVARGAMHYSPRVTPQRIGADLLFRTVTVARKDSTTGEAPLGYVLAAKKASKALGVTTAVLARAMNGSGLDPIMTQFAMIALGGRDKGGLALWRAAVKAQYENMAKARVRSAGFLKVGWLSVMTELRSLAGLNFGGLQGEAGIKLVGRLKSKVQIAKPGDNIGAIGIHLAKAAWDKRDGQYTKGAPALERALNDEAASMNKHMEDEMREATEQFNRAQH
jgi:hypothetical protein